MGFGRVLVTSNTLWSIYNFREDLIQGLIRRGKKVELLSLDSGGIVSFTPGSVPVLRRNNYSLRNLMAYIGASIVGVLRCRWRRVYSFTLVPNLVFGFVRPTAPFELFATVTGLGRVGLSRFPFSSVRSLYRFFLGRSDTTMVQNRDDYRWLSRARQRPVLVNGSGVNLERVAFQPPLALPRRRIVFLGRILPAKGIFVFLECAKAMVARRDDVEFYVYGSLGLDPLEQVRFWGFFDNERIVFGGWCNDSRTAFGSASCVVLPTTYHEGIPRSLIEALAVGRPIVSTRFAGSEVLVGDQQNGILLDSTTVPALIEAVDTLLDLSHQSFSEMCNSARRCAEKQFDVNLVLKPYWGGW